MRFGYARVSTEDQDLAAQLDALQAAGCDQVLSEKVSGRAVLRPELDRLLDKLRPGDQVVVWRLDRLGRSLKHLVALVDQFAADGVELISLQENIDTSTASGKMVAQIFAVLAEFERNLISERTKAGLQAARARGRSGGRPRALSESQLKIARASLQDPAVQISEVAKQLGVSRATLYRYLKSGEG